MWAHFATGGLIDSCTDLLQLCFSDPLSNCVIDNIERVSEGFKHPLDVWATLLSLDGGKAVILM